MAFWKTNEWADVIAFYVREIRLCATYPAHRRRSVMWAWDITVPAGLLNDHDWDDIRQSCLVRAWQKRHLYRRGLPLRPWLKTVVVNQVKNELRGRLAGAHVKQRCARLRWILEHPLPLGSREIVDPCSIRPRVTEEDLKLKPDEREALMLLMDHGTPTRFAKGEGRQERITGYCSQRQHLYKLRSRLRRRYREALNAA
jgi:DNA-directed RNA polymerase specialized sigma24 family protein